MFADFCRSLTSFSLKGRANKHEFVNFFLFWFFISFGMLITCFVLYLFSFNITVDFSTFSLSRTGEISNGFLACFVGLAVIFLLFEIWAFIAGSIVTVKRLHDINLTGLYYWLIVFAFILLCINDCKILTGFLAYVSLGGILFLSFLDSYPFSNKYDNMNDISLKDKNCNGEISV